VDLLELRVGLLGDIIRTLGEQPLHMVASFTWAKLSDLPQQSSCLTCERILSGIQFQL